MVMENIVRPENIPEKSPERPASPEVGRESEPQRETAPKGADVVVTEPVVPIPVSDVAAEPVVLPAVEKDVDLMRVERVLEENLWELYFALPKGTREQFRQEGEKTALAVREAMEAEKVRPGFIHRCIDLWLRIIPRVNPWFLLQEGKIKTDNVMTIVKEKRGEQ